MEMATSSIGQYGQYPPASAAPSEGGAEAHTFFAYLELRKEARRQHCQPAVVMHPELLMPTRCGHCRQLEDLRPARSAMPYIHGGLVSFSSGFTGRSSLPANRRTVGRNGIGEHAPSAASLLDQVAFEGNCCFECATVIYEKTRHLLDEPASSGGDTPLHFAARSRNLRILCHLISLVGEETSYERVMQVLRKPNDRGETALHEAVKLGSKDMAKLLMWVDSELARIPAAGQGTSPLYLAVFLGDMHIARMLHCASGTNLSYSGPDGQNALHAAVLHGQGMTKMLLDWNKDLSKQKDQNGSTPLHFAVSVEQNPFIRIWCFVYTLSQQVPTWHVLDANPSAVYQQDEHGLFPVHVAASTGRWAAISVLLKKCPGCVGLRDNQGRSFLHVAVQNKRSNVVSNACGRARAIFAPVMNIQDRNGNTALHVAVEVGDLVICCSLLGNPEVLLNLRNNMEQTPLDLAKDKIRAGFFYGSNPEKIIYRTLIRVGAKHGSCRWDHFDRIPMPTTKSEDEEKEESKSEDEEKEESDKLTSSAQILGIGSVLIATVTFSATFTPPGGYIADDHTNGGTPTLAGTWYFNAFMVASTLAFICSSVATIGLMYSGMAMVKLPIRRRHFNISLFFASSSVTCLTFAFALGVYMVLAPVGRKTAIAICAISPLVVIYKRSEDLHILAITSRPLRVRRGIIFAWLSLGNTIFSWMLTDFWAFIVIFGWAAHSRKPSAVHHHGL